MISVWKDLLKHVFTYFNPCNGEMKSEKMCAFKVLFKKFENIFTGKYLFNFVIIQHLWIKFENISASFDYSKTNNANDNYYWLGNYNNTCRNHCTNNTDTHNNCYHHRGSVFLLWFCTEIYINPRFKQIQTFFKFVTLFSYIR